MKTLPLTLPQEDIFFDQLLVPEMPIYNIGAKVIINGKLDLHAFENSYKAFVDQHDVLKFILRETNSRPHFDVREKVDTTLQFKDYSSSDNALQKVEDFIAHDFKLPFDLESDQLLFSFMLFQVAREQFILYSKYHHIITDGWGTSLLFQRLVNYYNQFVTGTLTIDRFDFPYENYIRFDKIYRNSDEFNNDLKYWSTRYASLPDKPFKALVSSTTLTTESRRHYIYLKKSQYNDLRLLSGRINCTVMHVILGVLFTYLYRFFHIEDLAIGLPVLNRSSAFFKKTVGLFAGMTPLRMTVNPESSFEELVYAVKLQLRADYRHQKFPLGSMVREVKDAKEKGDLFGVSFSYEKHNYSPDFVNTQTEVIPLSHLAERLPLAVYVREFDDDEDVKVDFDYNINHYSEKSIKALALHFETLISEVTNDSTQKIRNINIDPFSKSKQIDQLSKNAKVSYPINKTFYQLIDQQAIAFPDKVALQDVNNNYSYQEISELTDRYALILNDYFDNTESLPIAVLLDRSAMMVLMLISIAKSGRPYIPLDPSFPKQRLKYILQQSKTEVIICESKYSKWLDTDGIKEIDVDRIQQAKPLGVYFKRKVNCKREIAYIIYTSGSTGNPKGVQVPHSALVNFLVSMQSTPGIKSDDLLFAVTTYAFDISILEFFLPLITGATTYIVSSADLSEPEMLLQRLNEMKPTILQGTPSFYQFLYNVGWLGNKEVKIFCGGESLNKSLAEKLLFTNREVWNMYGPTETTIWSTTKKLNRSEDFASIGNPINNTQVLLLDEHFNIVPDGAIGKMYISGDGLAVGYHLRPDLTKEKFIPNPFNREERLYDTGDLAKWNDAGELQFFGRSDNQVKVRGYRIELADIENALLSLKEIHEAAVVCVTHEERGNTLVAYIKSESRSPHTKNILDQLRELVPNYMIPSSIIYLDEFPLTPNKKIDRKILVAKGIDKDQPTSAITPLTENELIVFSCWKEVLDDKNISASATFFENGGNSVNAALLLHLINKKFSISLKLRDVFYNPTIGELTSFIGKQKNTAVIPIFKCDIQPDYPISPFQSDLFEACDLAELSSAYNMFLVYKVMGNLDKLLFENSINSVIESFEILRTNFARKEEKAVQIVRSSDHQRFKISTLVINQNDFDEALLSLVNKRFDLENELLLKVSSILVGSEEFLVFITHHLLLDAKSFEIFIKTLRQAYNTGANKFTPMVHYKDYSCWITSKRINGQSYFQTINYWRKQLHELPKSHTFSALVRKVGFPVKKSAFKIDEVFYALINKKALEIKVSVFSLLTMSIGLLLAKLFNVKDFCVGIPYSCRNHPDTIAMMGMFINTLPIRITLEADKSITSGCHDINDQILQLHDFADFSFSSIGNEIGLRDSPFDVIVNHIRVIESSNAIYGFNGFELQETTIDASLCRVPLVFNVIDNNETMIVEIECNDEIDKIEDISILMARFNHILRELISQSIHSSLFNVNTILREEQVMREEHMNMNFDF